jgi:hypothetical protein
MKRWLIFAAMGAIAVISVAATRSHYEPLTGRHVGIIFRIWDSQRVDTVRPYLYSGARFETVGSHDFLVLPNQSDGGEYESWIPLADIAEIQVFRSPIATTEATKLGRAMQ